MKEFEYRPFGQEQDEAAPVESLPVPPAEASVEAHESVLAHESAQAVLAGDMESLAGMPGIVETDSQDDGGIGHPRVRRICRAAHVDLREARVSRWTDTVDLLTQRAPSYLQPFLAYAEG